MKPSFLTIKNVAAVEIEKIPVLAVSEWRASILENGRERKARVVALFGCRKEGRVRLYAVLGFDPRKELSVGAADFGEGDGTYPSLTPELPEVHLFEREIFETFGILPEGHPWLKPVRRLEHHPFYKVEGEGVHEVGVGPVHAGIIEPGHFRFQCHGEKVLHLEIQLGYQHRGVEDLLVSQPLPRQAVLAESIAGDTAVGHGMAWCHVIEGLSEKPVTPRRAQGLRAIALELERLANHVGDLADLSGDVGFLPSAAWFGRLRGEFLNLLMELTGNRFGRSFVRPGGVLSDLTPEMAADFRKRLQKATGEMKALADLFFGASSVLGRLEQTGVVRMETARELGGVGPAARASNLLRDVRHDYPSGLYRAQAPAPVKLPTGDVYARARVRSLESKRSLQFIAERLADLSPDKIMQPTGGLKPHLFIVSLIEGWRGEIAHCAFTNAEGKIERYKIVDPSFHNWPLLAMAMRGGAVSDFPLCNKSFNLSYAGHDL